MDCSNKFCGGHNFNKDCKEINYIANQITNVSLPDDKRWAPILHFFTWKNIFKMNYNN